MSKHHPPKGYNWAILHAGEMSAQRATDIMLAGDAVLVLAEAEGVRGVLRALQTRMGRIMLDAGLYTLSHFVFPPENGGAAILHQWRLIREEAPVDDRTNYARTHPTAPVHPSKTSGGAA